MKIQELVNCDWERACFYCAKKQLLGELCQKSTLNLKLTAIVARNLVRNKVALGPFTKSVRFAKAFLRGSTSGHSKCPESDYLRMTEYSGARRRGN